MTELSLIVETPNAGNVGHHFLISSSELMESDVVQASANASQYAVGPTYISVSRQKRQTLDNQTVREGTERIILFGVETSELKAKQLESLKELLTQHFDSLQLLLDATDGNINERLAMSVFPEMGKWLQHPGFQELPIARSFRKHDVQLQEVSSPAENGRRYRAWWKPALIVSCLFLGGLIYFDFGDEGEVRPPISEDEGQNKTVEFFAKEWACSPGDVSAGLLRAADWNRRIQTLAPESLKVDGEIVQLIKKMETNQPPERFFISDAVRNETAFQQFALSCGVSNHVESVNFRVWIFKSWNELTKLKLVCEDLSRELDGAKSDNALCAFSTTFSTSEGAVGAGDGFIEPKTPVFDRQDVMIYNALESVRSMLSDSGLAEALLADMSTDDLSGFIGQLRNSHEMVKEKINELQSACLKDRGELRFKQAKVQLIEFVHQLAATPE